MHRLSIALASFAAAGSAAVGFAAQDSTNAGQRPGRPTAAPARNPTTARRGALVTVRRSRFGRVIFDGRGRALYLFTRDHRGPSRCYGACARAWPPFLTKAAPRAARGVRAGLLGSVRRRGGTRQVTYAGQPLYYYVGDRAAGQILCQNVVEFGGTWLVVSPAGRAVR